MPPKKKAANGYKFAEPLPPGTLLESREKKVWRLGPSIGKGGFGEIYSAQVEGAKSKDYPYVVKVVRILSGNLLFFYSVVLFRSPMLMDHYLWKSIFTLSLPSLMLVRLVLIFFYIS